jgi:hypothetical protein
MQQTEEIEPFKQEFHITNVKKLTSYPTIHNYILIYIAQPANAVWMNHCC